MPTPSPIIAATVEVKSAVGSSAETTGMRLSDNPIPISALMIGRPIATTDPKAINKITTAAARPTPSVAGTALHEGITAQRDLQTGRAMGRSDSLDSCRSVLDARRTGPRERDCGKRDPARADLFGMVDGTVDVIDARRARISLTTAAVDARSLVLNTTAELNPVADGMCGRGEVVGTLRVGAVETIGDVGFRRDHAAQGDDADERGKPDDECAVTMVCGS